MNFLKEEIKDGVAHVFLDRGRSNALNGVLLTELADLLDKLELDDQVKGMLLYGKPGIFSSGLDLFELYDFDEEQMRDFWYKFIHLVQRFVRFRKPAVAVIEGHSPAGGCVLAICCDYRVMTEGEYGIGLNEVPVGIIVPDSIFDLYSFWIGRARAYRLLLEGALLSPQRALKMGLVDEMVRPEAAHEAALSQLTKYTQLNAETWQQTKLNLRKDLIEHFEKDPSEGIERMLRQWWAPSTRETIKTILEKLKSKAS
ncbi:enoyl-CoA hydratase/isomerase family protein [Olivibacter sitiensis]|uniref:enoyl-CoA hydratase/isomerase family protein n=1 Tax=Olivibacter sitiensis TaxID=376470 RepID=UPI0004150F95|nr:enoyl-CoA hydratase/isomerase family protein [Olivibacter sitiensis]